MSYINLINIDDNHTDFFNKNYKNKINDEQFFDNRTFGLLLYEDPCTPIPYNYIFRSYVKNNIKCIGPLCINNEFKCLYNPDPNKRDRSCYEVDHIIDRRSISVNKSKLDIAANLVLANGIWNGQLGLLSLENSNKEKRLIYGSIIDDVKLTIDLCS